jgi:hypothetical protein
MWKRRKTNNLLDFPSGISSSSRLAIPTMKRKLIPLAVLLSLLAGTGASLNDADHGQKKSKQEEFENSFLFFGTVFTEQGLLLPGAEVKVRRTSERNARWEAYSDVRGEFAVRVPKGDAYEIQIKAKGFSPMARTVDTKVGGRQDMVFHMQPAPKGKRK